MYLHNAFLLEICNENHLSTASGVHRYFQCEGLHKKTTMYKVLLSTIEFEYIIYIKMFLNRINFYTSIHKEKN